MLYPSDSWSFPLVVCGGFKNFSERYWSSICLKMSKNVVRVRNCLLNMLLMSLYSTEGRIFELEDLSIFGRDFGIFGIFYMLLGTDNKFKTVQKSRNLAV